MTSWDGLDRRRFPRVYYPCLVTIRHSETQSDVFLTHTENVGIGGVCLILKKGLKIFSEVDLEVDLMDTQEHIKCHGRVVWSIRRGENAKKKPLFYDIGVEFSDLAQEDQTRMNIIVQRLVKQGHKVAEY